MTRRKIGQAGAVYLEFLIVFVPVFTFFLLVLQFGLLQAGRLGVRHAAVAAARSAVVVLDDDPAFYDGQKRRSLVSTNCGGNEPSKLLSGLLGKALGSGSSGGAVPSGGSTCKGGARGGAVRTAAIAALMPFSPPLHTVVAGTSRGGDIVGIAGKALYAMAATGVSFPSQPGANSFASSFGIDDNVTARVTYLQHCSIPIASRLMCDSGLAIFAGVSPPERGQDLEKWIRVQKRLRAAKPWLRELLDHSSQKVLTGTLLLKGRYSVEQAEATLPLQGASYAYPKGSPNAP